MFISFVWIPVIVIMFVVICVSLFYIGGCVVFSSERFQQLVTSHDDYRKLCDVRTRERNALQIEYDKLSSIRQNDTERINGLVQEVGLLEKENQNLRQMILEAKNVLMES